MEDFNLYKLELKNWYEKVKDGENRGYLLKPSQANLRKLCIEICRERKEQDLKTFRHFLGFDFNESVMRRIKDETDKFRPITRFLRNESELTEVDSVEMLAMLVGYPHRSLSDFRSKKAVQLPPKEEGKQRKGVGEDPVAGPKTTEVKRSEDTSLILFVWEWIRRKKLLVIGIILFGGVFFSYSIYEKFTYSCMQWQTTHYEKVKCEARQGIGNPINPIDTAQFKVRKIPVSRNTVFFIKGKAIVWYVRNNGYEFYDHPGYHPLLGKEKELKEVSKVIAEGVRNGTIKPNY